MNQQSTKLASLSLAFMVLLSVFAGSLALVGTAAAANMDDTDADVTLEDGQTYWVGQTLFSDESANSDETYEVRGADDANSGYFQQVRVTSEGALLIDTSNMEAGSYTVEDHENTEVATFTVAEQSFNVSTADEDASDTTYTFEFDSNRVGFDVLVEADGFTAEDLEGYFSDGELRDVDDDSEDEYVLTDVSDGDELDATFDEEDAGEYDFTFSVVDTSASDTVEGFSVAEPDDADAQFSDSLYTEEEGDIASFNVTFENTDEATVVIGDEEELGYEATFTVTDGNEDGVVTVEYNTWSAGQGDDSTVSVADSEDSVEFTAADDETDISEYGHLGAYTYSMSLIVNEEERDIASLIMNDRSTDDASTHVVPKGDKTNDADDINENAVAGDTVALNDKLVVAFDTSGVYAPLADASQGADDLVEGTQFATDNGLYVSVEETNPGINRDAQELDVSEATLRVDAENDMFYLVFDTANAAFDLEDGDEYEATLHLTEENPYIEDEDSEENVSAVFSVVDREAQFDAYDDREEVVYVNPEANFTLSGESTLAPGTELTLIARAEGEAPFLYSEDVVVADDGTFGADFDFSGLSEGTEFTVAVRGFGELDAKAVLDGPREYDLSANAVDENGEAVEANISVDGEAYEGDALALTNGTYTVSASAEGYEDASQTVTIDGDSESVTLTMALPPEEYDLSVSAVDENGSSVDATITVDGEVVSDSIALENGTYTVEATADGFDAASQEVTIDGDSQSATLTLAEEETETPTTEEPNNSSEEPATTEDPGQPGFGLIVSLVALIGAALLAVRRQD